ncbi:hypothetical protein [Devosia sp.]|uniref:hypothetical protein n=1 Tax=Devosia sp. TaxID=1871048 RepID=UPI003A8F553A
MELTNKAKSSFWRSPILWGVLATVLVFVGFWAVVLMLGKPISDHSLSLNEVGDFFSGMAAPLAFIWLVVAVFLQRHELQAQREQLEQQKEELRLSREQLIAQGEELRRQSESLQHQEAYLALNQRTEKFRHAAQVVLDRLLQATDGAVYHPPTGERHGMSEVSYQPGRYDELSRKVAAKLQVISSRPGGVWPRRPNIDHIIPLIEKLKHDFDDAELRHVVEPYRLEQLIEGLKLYSAEPLDR